MGILELKYKKRVNKQVNLALSYAKKAHKANLWTFIDKQRCD